jgi:AraC family transcriptional regulator
MDSSATVAAPVAFETWDPVGTLYDVGEEACRPARGGPLEMRYGEFAVGFVLSGWFDYRAQGGSAMGGPGGMIFGNLGEHFHCRHLDPAGNRRLVVRFDNAFLEEVADDGGLRDLRFPAVAMAPGPDSARMFGWMRKLARRSPGCDEAAIALADAALKIGPQRGLGAPISPQERRRIQAVVRHIETAYAEPCSLKTLAELAGLSRWHFVRRFHEVAGQSPNQFLIHTRIRAAADRLLAGPTPIAEVALDVGFNDISHFNASFRAIFGCAPRDWRAGRAG